MEENTSPTGDFENKNEAAPSNDARNRKIMFAAIGGIAGIVVIALAAWYLSRSSDLY